MKWSVTVNEGESFNCYACGKESTVDSIVITTGTETRRFCMDCSPYKDDPPAGEFKYAPKKKQRPITKKIDVWTVDLRDED